MIQTIEATFLRKPPPYFAEGNGIPSGWVCISFRWITDTRDRRKLYGTWVKIQSSHGVSYRVLRFSGSLRGTQASGEGEIVLDWSAWLELSGFSEDSSDLALPLKITRARWYQRPFVGFFHPDPTYRLANLLAYLALALAFISLFT